MEQRCMPVLLLCSLPFFGHAQAPPMAWETFFDGSLPGLDEARDLIVAPDNSVYVTGAALHMVPQGTITTLRYSHSGTELMSDHVYGPSQETMNEGEALALDAEGHVYVAGAFSANDGDMGLIKYGPGGRLWRKNYEPYWFGSGSDRALDVAVGTDGSPCLAGSITSLSGMGLENFILKADSTGEQIWTDQSSPSSTDEWATQVAVANDGSVYLAGHWWNIQGTGGIDVSVARYAAGGTRLWDRGFSAPGMDERALGIATTQDGGVVVCGTAQGSMDNDLLVFARSADGTLLWGHLLDGSGTGNDEAVEALVLPDSRVAVAGHMMVQVGAANRHAVVLMMIDGDQVIWSEEFTGEAALGAWATDLSLSADGRLLVSGYETATGGTTTNGLLLCYGNDGEQLWHVAYDGGLDQNDRFNAVAVNDAGDVIVCGTAYTDPSSSRYVTVQYGHAVGILESEEDTDLVIQPSIASVGRTVSVICAGLTNASCTITDAQGRNVLHRSFTGHLDWTPATPGSYMVTLSQHDHRRSARLIVIR